MTSPTPPTGTTPPSATTSTPPPGAPAATRPPRPRPVGWGLALIALGVLWLLSLAGVEIRWQWVLPAAIVVVGLLILTIGRRGVDDSLIGLGVVLTVAALFTTVLPGNLSVSAGDRTYTVTQPADLDSSYALGAGSLTLDLRELEPAADPAEIRASVSLGELVVLLPEDATVTGTAATGMGEVVMFDRTSEGIAPALTVDEPGSGDGPEVVLDLDVGLGSIEVTR